MMHLGVWAVSLEQRCIVGQISGHVVCFLFLQLQWSCSLCGSVYVQVSCWFYWVTWFYWVHWFYWDSMNQISWSDPASVGFTVFKENQ